MMKGNTWGQQESSSFFVVLRVGVFPARMCQKIVPVPDLPPTTVKSAMQDEFRLVYSLFIFIKTNFY
jgi:hypothetical protein